MTFGITANRVGFGPPVDARERADHEDANVGRILVGVGGIEDDGAFEALEDVAKGMGLL